LEPICHRIIPAGVLYYRDEDIDPMRRHGQQHEIANADITGVTSDSAEALDG
jgi:hypothetical protein